MTAKGRRQGWGGWPLVLVRSGCALTVSRDACSLCDASVSDASRLANRSGRNGAALSCLAGGSGVGVKTRVRVFDGVKLPASLGDDPAPGRAIDHGR
jgi:hypothetical protein